MPKEVTGAKERFVCKDADDDDGDANSKKRAKESDKKETSCSGRTTRPLSSILFRVNLHSEFASDRYQ